MSNLMSFLQGSTLWLNPLFFLVSASIGIGIWGSYTVGSRSSYFVSTISHSVLGGIGFSLWMGSYISWLTPSIGAYLAAILAILFLHLIQHFYAEQQDILLSILWAGGMALGILFISLSSTMVSAERYLFGDLLLISSQEIYTMSLFSLVTLVFVLKYYRLIDIVIFDPDFAKTRHLPVFLIQLALQTFLTIAIILLVQAVGIILIVALLSIPSSMAQHYAKSFKQMIVYSSSIMLSISVLGFFISLFTDLPAGPVIILLLIFAYLVSLFFKHHKK